MGKPKKEVRGWARFALLLFCVAGAADDLSNVMWWKFV